MSQTADRRQPDIAIFLIGVLFFIFGFITWANSQLIPYLKLACELTDTQSYYVATAFFAAYFVMALPSSYLLRIIGFKNGMSAGLLVMALGALLFVPAAAMRQYSLFLSALFLIGTGLALLQTAANPYVTILGPIESAAQRISIMGICNKVAGILAVYILGGVILENADALKASLPGMIRAEKDAVLDALAAKVIVPYLTIAAVLLLLGFAFFKVRLPDIREDAGADNIEKLPPRPITAYPYLFLGALSLFLYVGVEVISYDTFSSFGEYLGFPLSQSRSFASYTGYGLLAGYLLSIVAIPKYISQRNALIVAALLSMLLVTIAAFSGGSLAIGAFALLGFSNAIMWPAIWPLAIDGLGGHTKTGSALLIMGIVGGAVLPPLYGVLADLIASKQQAYLMMIPCYAFILYFAARGYQVGRRG